MVSKIIFLLVFVLGITTLFLTMSSKQHMVVVYEGNHEKTHIEMQLNHFQDSDCGMVIDDITYASQIVAPSGKTWFFHDHGGMVNWIKNRSFKDEAIIWTRTKDTKKWLDGRKLWFSRDDDTPMGYGFGAFENYKDGLVDFQAMYTYMVRGEHMGNAFIKKQLLEKK